MGDVIPTFGQDKPHINDKTTIGVVRRYYTMELSYRK